jgi:histidyl-tRNA synthetase
VAVLFGETELAQGHVLLKDLTKGEQLSCAKSEVTERVRKILLATQE